MSDPFDVALRGLRGQRPPAPFAPPEAVRRRGRQRSTHQAVAAGVAVLAVVGGTAGWLSGYGGTAAPDFPPGATTAPPSSATPTQSTSPGATPSPTGPPQSSASPFLTTADLGAGNWRLLTDSELFGNGKSYWSPPLCPVDRPNQHPTTGGITDFNGVAFRNGGEGQQHPPVVYHLVERYAPGTTAARLDEIRAALQRCSRTTKWPQDGSAPTRYTVTPVSGVGDAAFLVRSEVYVFEGEELSTQPFVTLDVVLRVGDRVATVHTSIVDEGYLRTLAIKAAERLR